MQTPRHNWAGNLTYSSEPVQPESLEQLQEIVAKSAKVRPLGTRHSFNPVADTDGALVSLERLPRQVRLDREGRRVTVGGGMRYGDFVAELHAAGFALHNLASLPHISVAGACATATHGSGDRNPNLATAVVGLELVNASGELERWSPELRGPEFAGAAVSLGALGVAASITLELRPAFELRQDVYENLGLDALERDLDAVFSGYSTSLFTRWEGRRFHQVWRKRRAEDGPAEREWLGASRLSAPRHMLPELPVDSLTPQLGLPGPWFEWLPHFRLDHTPSVGAELQSEYFVPRDRALDALGILFELGPRLAPALLVSEVRSVAADDLWLSPCYRQPCVGLHFTWKPDWPAVRQLLPLIEARLGPLAARPHWGKLFTTPLERLPALFPRLGEFKRLVQAHDPQGKFRNPFLEGVLSAA